VRGCAEAVPVVTHQQSSHEPSLALRTRTSAAKASETARYAVAREHPVSRRMAATSTGTDSASWGQSRAIRSVSASVGRLSRRRLGTAAPFSPWSLLNARAVSPITFLPIAFTWSGLAIDPLFRLFSAARTLARGVSPRLSHHSVSSRLLAVTRARMLDTGRNRVRPPVWPVLRMASTHARVVIHNAHPHRLRRDEPVSTGTSRGLKPVASGLRPMQRSAAICNVVARINVWIQTMPNGRQSGTGAALKRAARTFYHAIRVCRSRAETQQSHR